MVSNKGENPVTSTSEDQDPYGAFREQIDRIDAQMLALLDERARVALEIGKLKRQRNEPIHVPEREQAILERLERRYSGLLPGSAVRKIFCTIIAQVRAFEESH